MPIVKYPRATEPLWHEWDRKAQKCGLRHTVYAVNGDQYTGEWLDNLKHGKGMQVWKHTGAIYSGDWKFGNRDGYGSYSIPDSVTKEYKKVYVGWWKNNQKCGYGLMFYPSGERYEGEWSRGLRSGWGRMYYQDGSIYEGQWLEDQPGGQGMLRLRKYWPPLPEASACPPSRYLVSVLLSRCLCHPDSWMLHRISRCSLASGLQVLPCVVPPLWVWGWRQHWLCKGQRCAAQAHMHESLFLL
ncbi:MORN repeat-containing protein 3 isoform X1 [Tyto alba]|uniref:MORN repeat-containing protein 3 isoform X1 n=1 Tax=Tyto alba TaxID=56313 RepID=UPI001C685FCA|nr:MORN repeat-containing protein 3 isoform X1 [Tyto alba]XP_032864273.2 MORN repeat-containing protein 3 isoform X1 [Tyto alba]XP_032864274.2 MORN repeat-containing protein 3 isoform X1 [Tyto alba]